MADRTLRKHVESRLRSLSNERSSYIDDWEQCSDFVLGIRARFLRSKRDKKVRDRNENLYNEQALYAAQIMASGMVSGLTSPARPWFKLGTPDTDLMEFGPVKEWLSIVEKKLLLIYSRSNFYNSMYNTYLDVGTYGCGPIGVFEDFDNVARYDNYEIGSYFLGIDGNRRVDTIYREYSKTVGGLVKKFGEDNVSRAVKKLWDDGNLETAVPIIHAIEPNDDRKFDSPFARDMPYRSVYFEAGQDNDDALGQSGFNEQPFMAPRWHIIGEDTYASLYPGINSIGTNKSMQVEELDKAIAIEKMHNPPLVADSSMENSALDLIAGGVSFAPNMGLSGKPSLQSIYDVNLRISDLKEDIMIKEQRIMRHFFADLFLMISDMDRAQITATEIAERKEEKLLMLGPVLERLKNELHDPVIDRTFNMAQRAGILPPPPKELSDINLEVEYISVLAQAQKAVSTASMESTAAFTLNLAVANPEVLDKIDMDQMVNEHANAKGAPVKTIRSDSDVKKIREDRAKQQNIAAAQQSAAAAAESAKTLSETPVDNGSMLDAITGAVS